MFPFQSFRSVAVLAACLLWPVIGLMAQPQDAEFRGLWVDAWHSGYRSREEITALVNTCKTYHFNAVVAQMRRRGDALYFPRKPNCEPRTTIVPEDFDALQELIVQCHQSSPRIEVHCWVTTFLVWGDGKNAPPQRNHVFNAHPEYLMQNSTGQKHLSEGFYLDPGHPDANQWLYDMAKDIVTRYDIDGFHWDYVRYPQQDSGYNPTAIARYNAEFGLAGKPSPDDPHFSKWRRRQVTDFLRWVDADLLAIKPKLVLSSSVFGSRTDALNARFQDWGAWCQEGILDLCCPMNYTPDMTLFKSRCDVASSSQGSRQVCMGLGAYMNTMQATLDQLVYVRKKGFAGSLFYSYAAASKAESQADTFSFLRDKHQPSWVPTPALSWKTNPANGLLKGTVTRAGQPIYNATVSVEGVAQRSQMTEPHGRFAFFELPPGSYVISADLERRKATQQVDLKAGQISNIDLALVEETAALAAKVQNAPVKPANNVSAPNEPTKPAATNVTSTVALIKVPAGSVFGPPAPPDKIEPSPIPHAPEKRVAPVASTNLATVAQISPSVAPLPLANAQPIASNKPSRQVETNVAPPKPVLVSAPATRAIEVKPVSAVNEPVKPVGSNVAAVAAMLPTAAKTPTRTVSTTAIQLPRTPAAPADLQDIVDPTEPVPDIILDNSEAEIVGDWIRGSAIKGGYGTDYRFLSKRGTGTKYVTYVPNIPHRGIYEVFEWHSQHENRAADAPHTINHVRGSDTITVNQRTNGGQWNSLGQFLFDVGKIGTIVVSDEYTVGHVIVADAFKLVYVPRSPQQRAAISVARTNSPAATP